MDGHRRSAPLEITLALEGGGALGAFTGGVLERLLDLPDLRIAAVSGTSAGAMNAAVLAQGLARGGVDDAKELMETFWQRVAIAAGSLPGPSARWITAMGAPAPNNFAINPLRGILNELLHLPALGRFSSFAPSLFAGHGAEHPVLQGAANAS